MTITIEVTEADILHGTRGRCSRCPVALAVQRATGNSSVRIGKNWISGILFTEDGEFSGREWNERVPLSARRFMRRFDCGERTRPFSFDIEVPERAVNPGLMESRSA